MTSTDVIMLKSGHRAAVHVLTEGTTGRTVALCHPGPGSGSFDPDPEVTRARRVALIGVGRPRSGGPDPPSPARVGRCQRRRSPTRSTNAATARSRRPAMS